MEKRKEWISLKISASGRRGSRVIITPEGMPEPWRKYILYLQVPNSQPPETMTYYFPDGGYKIDILGDIHEATIEVKKRERV